MFDFQLPQITIPTQEQLKKLHEANEMIHITTAEELEQQLKIAAQQMNAIAARINNYVASDDYKNSLKSITCAFNLHIRQLNQRFTK